MVKAGRRGFTLVELMMVAACFGFFLMSVPRLVQQVNRFFRVTHANAQMQQSGRTMLDEIIRQASRSAVYSIYLDAAPGAPPQSRAVFSDATNAAMVRIWQDKDRVYVQDARGQRELGRGVRQLCFWYDGTSAYEKNNTLSIALVIEAAVGAGEVKTTQVSRASVKLYTSDIGG